MAAVPLSYKLTIKTSFPASFSGVAEIRLYLPTSTSHVSLNTAASLRLLGAVLVSDGKRVSVKATQHDELNEITSLVLAEEVAAGEAVLAVRWEGSLEGNMLGYYRMSASSGDESQPAFYAATHFQPTHARQAFPCFDHPAKKASFSISLLSPRGLDSLSNSAEKSRTPSDGSFAANAVLTPAFLRGVEGKLAEASEQDAAEAHWELVEFGETPRMSTYLAAWAVGSFEATTSSYVSPLTQRVVPLAVFASKPAGYLARGQGQLALDTLARVMPVYEKIFGIPYEMPKLDVVICDEFDCSAMENWGLICGSTAAMLYDETLSGVAAKRMVVSTVAHECAHMWFGNLVTPEWWDGLWLNEGFASLIGEVVAVEHLYPEWNPHSSFIKAHRSAALQVDALRHSHPVHMCCKHESEVTQTFDHISYEKGSAVLKMLMSLIGANKFLEGTSNYLKTHCYGSTTSKDLWRAFSAISDFDIEDLLGNWIEKAGFPIVIIEEEGDNLKLRQKRFLVTGDAQACPSLLPLPSPSLLTCDLAQTADDTTLWTIPLFVKNFDSDETPTPILMKTRELTLNKPGQLYLLNGAANGLYRVAYPPSHLEKLAAEASKTNSRLSLADRFGIVQDVVALSEAGYSSTVSTLDFLRHVAVGENEYLVWSEVAGAFKRLQDAWWEQPGEVNEAFKALGRQVFSPMVSRLGFERLEGEDDEVRRFRASVLTAAAVAENLEVLAWIRTSFAGFLTGRVDPTAADLAALIVWAMAYHGGEQEYEVARQIYENPPTPSHQIAAIAGLTGTRDVDLLKRTMGMMVSGEVQPDRLPGFLAGLSSNPHSRRLTWSFFQQAWPALEQQFKGSMLLGNIASVAFESFSSETDAAAVEAFFAEKDTVAYDQPLRQGLDTVRSKARWLARDAQPVQGWLEKEGYMRKQGAEEE
ncbi:hypothetical protein JCM10213_003080 [Rhodosporidiobolus nylandii]